MLEMVLQAESLKMQFRESVRAEAGRQSLTCFDLKSSEQEADVYAHRIERGGGASIW